MSALPRGWHESHAFVYDFLIKIHQDTIVVNAVENQLLSVAEVFSAHQGACEILSLMRLGKQIGCHAWTIVGILLSWRFTGGAKSLKRQLRTSENARLRPSTE